VDEPAYDPREDLDRFNAQAHVVLVTVKALDHAQENLLRHLREIRRAAPARPVVLALTCLHEAYPQRQHPSYSSLVPGPWSLAKSTQDSANDLAPAANDEGPGTRDQGHVLTDLARSLEEQGRRFAGLVDVTVPVDLTRPEEGFTEPEYGGGRLKQVLLDVLPAAYRQTLLTLGEATRGLQDLYARHALPHIAGYSSLAATAGALPVPWVDLLILPGIQTRMIYHVASLYGQPLSATRFLELAGTLGLGILVRQAAREVVKFVPYVGSVAGGALAAASTFALGKAFCYYYSAVHQGHVPRAEDLKRYYREQLALAETFWKKSSPAPAAGPGRP
jgi:uncharacterized protein (DUF697 family)